MRRYFIFILLVLGSCTERLDVKEEDLQKYPEILPFLLLEHEGFRGEHFLDPGWLHFSYTPTKNSDPIRMLDSVALKEGWQIENTSNLDRVYLKEIKSYPADNGLDSLIVSYSTENNRLIFKRH